MELLVLLLISPVIFAQNYHPSRDPNNEPFLPIYPNYPYSPKLIKRGTEKATANPGTQDSYGSKPDLRESYSSSFPGKDSYYPQYNTLPKTPASPISNFPSSFPSNPFGSSPFGSSAFGSPAFGSTPFGANSLGANAFGANSLGANAFGANSLGANAFGANSLGANSFGGNSFGANSFGSAPFGSSPFGANPYSSLNPYAGAFQNSPLTQSPAGQFPPGNFPPFYPPQGYLPNFYNQYPPQLGPPGANYPNKNDEDDDDDDRRGKKGRGRYKEDNDDDTQFRDGGNFLSSSSRDLDGQSSTYKGSGSFKSNSNSVDKLNGIPGQSPNLDYASNSFIKSQQLEQLMRQTLIKLLAQSVAQQVNQAQHSIYESSTNSPGLNILNGNNIRNNDGYTPGPSGLAKTGLPYVVSPSVINKVPNQIGVGQVPTTQLINKNPRFPEPQYQKSPGLYLTPLKANRNPVPIPSPDYGDYETQPSQVDQNYQASSNQEQRASFKSKTLVTQTPQTSSFEYSSYQPSPTTKASEQKELDNVSIHFSNKQKDKRG